MRRSRFYLAFLGGLAAVVAAVVLRCGGWMAINPEFQMARLGGLSAAQVRSRLGPPDFDNWVPGNRFGPTNEATMGPHVMCYYQGLETRKITFQNGRVATVERFGK